MTIEGLINRARNKNSFYVSSYAANAVVESVIKEIIIALENGEEVVIPNFGIFKVKHRAARIGRNPQTNTPVEIPARNMPVFVPAKRLKDRVVKSKNIGGESS